MPAVSYAEQILDLGEHGVLALTLDGGGYAPLPAHLHGYAHWHCPAGERVDCAGLCFRAVSAADMRATVASVASRLARAVASVRDYHEWVGRQIAEPCREAPTRAVALSRGRALLMFAGEHRPHLLRLVDVPAQRVLWDEPLDALRQRLGWAKPQFGSLDQPILYCAAGDHVLLAVGDKPQVLQVGDGQLDAVTLAGAPEWLEGEFTGGHFVARERDSLRLDFLPLGDLPRKTFQPKGRKAVSYHAPLAAATAGERVSISYEGGLVEVIEGTGATSTLLRPIPRAGGKDIVGMTFSPSGRYAVAATYDTARLIDWDTMRIASVALPRADIDSGERGRFEPDVHYRPGWAVTDRGGFVVERGKLTFTPTESLQWAPIETAAGMDGPAPDAQLAALRGGWTRPAVSLLPARKRGGPSHLYGAPILGGGEWTWPEHDGVPMWLLCELDLAQVHAATPGIALPTQGALLFFVAVDSEGEPLMRHESFDPLEVQVLHLPVVNAASSAIHSNPWSVAEQPLTLRADAVSDWPQADAAVVRAASLSDAQMAEYQTQLEAHSPDGAAEGHRVGGYPHLLQPNYLEVQADAISRGLSLESAELTWEAAARWRLLLQLDSDDVYMWGTDSGMLYFMIRDDDLERGDFSRVVALTAGY